LQNNAPVLQNNAPVLQNNAPVLQNNAPVLQNNAPVLQDPSSLFIRINEKTIQCNFCNKILNTHYARHGLTCKGVPRNVCKYCKKQFNIQSTHSRHQKNCKARPVVTQETLYNNNSGTTIIVNNYNDNRMYIQNNTFGHENLTVILNKLEEDPRLQEAVLNFKTALSLVHFNKDFPENQTIRKMNKRSNTIELRQSVDPERWDLEPFETGFGRVMNNLQRHLKLNLSHVYPLNYIRDHMYHLSKVQPAASTSEIIPPTALVNRQHDSEDRERLHQIAIEERDQFIKDQCTNWQLDRSNVDRCRAFKDRLHDTFRKSGLSYEVVNTHEPSQFWHFFQFLSKRQHELKYVKARL